MTDITNFLDLRDALVNELSGSTIIFLIVFNLLVFVMCAMFRMDNRITLIMMVLFNVIVSAILSPVLLAIVIFLVALFYAPIFKKILER